jgi:DNA-binding transcriptional MerR regulator
MLQMRRTFRIGEAAAALSVSTSWLRLAERLGVIPLARRTHGGQRRYSAEDIEQLRILGVGSHPKQLRQHDTQLRSME